MATPAPPSPDRPGPILLRGFLDLRPRLGAEPAAVAAFQIDPSAVAPTPRTGFTFTGGVYQILSVPGSISSDASGINGAGLIVGAYEDLSGALRGYANNGGTFTNIDFPGARATEPVGVNDAGQIVGSWFDAADDIVGTFSDATGAHGFLLQGGVFTPISFRSPPTRSPLASATPGRSPARSRMPAAPSTASSTPAGPSASWTSPAPAARF